eukprot:7301048-Karenia_brevis.AAC.1
MCHDTSKSGPNYDQWVILGAVESKRDEPMRDDPLGEATPEKGPQTDPSASKCSGDSKPLCEDKDMKEDCHSSCPSLEPPT